VDWTNSAWRILADFHISSGGFEKNDLATLHGNTFLQYQKGKEYKHDGGLISNENGNK
jgi:hypothetical protein